MKKKMMGALAIFSILYAPHALTKYYQNKRISKAQSNVVKLTPVNDHNTGGTGFSMRMPSGSVYTITNAHICRISKDGRLSYTQDNKRYGILHILEISKDSDLCVLSPVPGTEGFDVGSGDSYMQEIFIFGHPKLQDLTFSYGQVLNKIQADIVTGFNITKEECDIENGTFKELPENSLSRALFGIANLCVVEYEAYRTTAIIYPGNSGSPVLNEYGNVIGVVFAAYSETNTGLILTLGDLKEFISRY